MQQRSFDIQWECLVFGSQYMPLVYRALGYLRYVRLPAHKVLKTRRSVRRQCHLRRTLELLSTSAPCNDIPNRIEGVCATCSACRKRIQSFNFVCRSQSTNFNLNKWQSNCMQHVKRKVRRAVRNYKQDGKPR